jgi:hypothetical protein
MTKIATLKKRLMYDPKSKQELTGYSTLLRNPLSRSTDATKRKSGRHRLSASYRTLVASERRAEHRGRPRGARMGRAGRAPQQLIASGVVHQRD